MTDHLPLQNAFAPLTNIFFNNYQTIGADALHWYRQGMFRRVWFKNLIGDWSKGLKQSFDSE